MALHIIIGFDGPGNAASPTVVYAGRSKSEADAARLANTTSPRFECFQNARGYQKNNPNFAAPRAESVESVDTPAPAPTHARGRKH